ncbi:hypothetical protein VCHA53O464_50047 [Vibrio chagasii]|nr:hypothetical protein VCHA53O464_50047 [Vibrio chagasii]
MNCAQCKHLYQARYRPLVTKRKPHYALKFKNVNEFIIYLTKNIIKKKSLNFTPDAIQRFKSLCTLNSKPRYTPTL